MVRAILRSLLAGCCIAVLVSGCESGPLIDAVPSQIGGLPAGAPERPATPYKFPAVHDMPPPRGTDPLTDEQQYKLNQELQKVRDRQERLDTTKKASTGTKKQATGAK
jgi:hypothetical protein